MKKRSRTSKTIAETLKEIEEKQEKLCRFITQAKEKLEQALKTNKKIKKVLKKSRETQERVILTTQNFPELKQCLESLIPKV